MEGRRGNAQNAGKNRLPKVRSDLFDDYDPDTATVATEGLGAQEPRRQGVTNDAYEHEIEYVQMQDLRPTQSSSVSDSVASDPTPSTSTRPNLPPPTLGRNSCNLYKLKCSLRS